MEFIEILEIVFIVSALIVFVLSKVNVPSLVGFLFAGVIIGPYGVGIVKDAKSIEIIAEIGVILLLFSIGIEFSLKKLVRIKKIVLAGGTLQVSLTTALTTLFAYFLFRDIRVAIFSGFLVSLSSTAIVLKVLSEKGEIDTPYGKTMVGILIFQDLFVVIMMLLVPMLSGEEVTLFNLAQKIIKAVLIIGVVLLSSKYIFPFILHQVVHSKSRELFIISIIVICLGIAIVTSWFGLSLALGAFLAGLIISESEYAHQALSDIIPFKESFMGLFFVSVGMLLSFGFVVENFPKIFLVLLAIVSVKFAAAFAAVQIINVALRPAIVSAIGLSQIGEFSFILAIFGKNLKIIDDSFYQLFLASSVITMMISPFLINVAPKFANYVSNLRLVKSLFSHRGSVRESFSVDKKDHTIIIGFGLNGRNLARVLKESSIPYVVLDMNNFTVLEMKKKGEPIFYGDGTSIDILHSLGIENAKLLVIAISDPSATRRIVSLSRKINPKLYIIVRTRYVAEVDDLKSLGANEVIPEEFETSIEIFARVLKYYHFPLNVIMNMVESIRENSYTALRKISAPKINMLDHYQALKELEIESYMVTASCNLIDRSIKELEIRKKTKVNIIAIKRGDELFANPSPDFRFKDGDIVIFVGKPANINNAIAYFNEICGKVCEI